MRPPKDCRHASEIVSREGFTELRRLERERTPLSADARAKREGARRRLAGLTGLEPATSCVTGRRSNQLNYNPAPFAHGEMHAHNAKERGTIATTPEGVNERATRSRVAFGATNGALAERRRDR